MRLTNTLDGQTSEFSPLAPPRVGIYVCGPTVYDVPHVGHARAAVVFDVLRRHLTWRGFDVLFVRNVTDVDDKIIDRAKSDGVHPAVLAERYTRVYDDAMRALWVLDPDIAPRASGHIPEMISMIQMLIDRGFAYEGGDSVWFSVTKFEGYGKLSGRTIDVLLNKERVDPDPGKAHALDFALWKGAKPGEPTWESPWGPGRPGWHIECSAMAERYLGIPFDIHGGGADLIFPHHENEIAQAEAACGLHPFARWWVHNGHVQIDGEKMSKSLRNYVQVDAVLEEYAPQVLRLFFVSSHYRSQINYTVEALEAAKTVWERFAAFLRTGALGAEDEDLLSGFGKAMDDDLNTPEAIAALHGLVSDGNRALESGDESAAATYRASVACGLDLLGCEPEAPVHGDEVLGPLVRLLLEQREHAREAKNFARADDIRDRLAQVGVQVEDSADGPRWFVK